MVAYALLGSTWLVMKSENALQQRMRQLSESASAPASGIHCGNQYLDPSRPTSYCCALVYSAESVLSAACSCAGSILSLCRWRCLHDPASHTLRRLSMTLGLVFLGFSGLGISIWPHIIRRTLPSGRPLRPRKARALC